MNELMTQAVELIERLDNAFALAIYTATRDGDYRRVNRIATARERAVERFVRRAKTVLKRGAA